MPTKITKCKWPTGHGPSDFKCYGPPAEKDGQFTGTKLVDMGCFKQDGTDSNKYYHGAVVQSNIDSEWYAYFEYGRTGVTNPSFQFTRCNSETEACSVYEKQMHAKNDKRGQWINHPTLGRILQAKPKKDCYLVRAQATRSTGLPDAKTITSIKTTVKVSSKTKKGIEFDKESTALLKDLNASTMEYTRTSMATGAIPTQEAIDEARTILTQATGTNNPKELEDLTKHLYSRIPKKKGRKESWLLNPTRIQLWSDDLDAFESALLNQDTTTVSVDYPFHLEYFPNKGLGKDIREWVLKASQNRHGHLRNNMKIVGLWQVEKPNDFKKFRAYQLGIQEEAPRIQEQPLHQMDQRVDLKDKYHQLYKDSGTHMLFHGTRSVNVAGIMQQSLRMPKASSWGMFGAGIYWADDWRKSHGYTSDDGSYFAHGGGKAKSRRAFMFIGDVALGNPWVAPGSNSSLNLNLRPKKGFHSVFGKSGRSGVANNEFIVYNESANNLRYLIEFYV